MISNEFGLVFRDIRKQKGFTVDSFEELGVSKSTISRFENGKASLDIDQLYICLHEMKVALYEFEQFYRDFTYGGFDRLFSKFYEEYYARDVTKLKKEIAKTRDPLLRFAIKCLYLYVSPEEAIQSEDLLTDFEKDTMIDYLFEVAIWGYYELMLLNCTIPYLGTKQIIKILEDLQERTKNYRNILHYQRLIVQILIKGAFALILAGQKTRSREILNHALRFIAPDNLFSRTICLLVVGVWNYEFTDKDNGLKEIRAEIHIFEELKSYELANFYRFVCKKYFQIVV